MRDEKLEASMRPRHKAAENDADRAAPRRQCARLQ